MTSKVCFQGFDWCNYNVCPKRLIPFSSLKLYQTFSTSCFQLFVVKPTPKLSLIAPMITNANRHWTTNKNQKIPEPPTSAGNRDWKNATYLFRDSSGNIPETYLGQLAGSLQCPVSVRPSVRRYFKYSVQPIDKQCHLQVISIVDAKLIHLTSLCLSNVTIIFKQVDRENQIAIVCRFVGNQSCHKVFRFLSYSSV